MKHTLPAWPYPRWIAHRGAGKLAPENTLAAFRLGADHGYRMFECDVKLSADEVPFLLHDATLERTSNGQGSAGAQPWSALAKLDAGSWHSATHAGESLPTLDAVAAFCLQHGYRLNIEIKPTPGTARHTGEVVARRAAALWAGQAVPPLLSSFEPEALEGARTAAPALPRAFLFDGPGMDWLEVARARDCAAVVGNYRRWTAKGVAAAHAAGLRVLAYTVNGARSAERLWAWGLDGLITDRVDRFRPG